MSPLRHRLVALTCAAAATLALTGVATADAVTSESARPSAAALAATHPGLARLLAAGTPTQKAIVRLPSVPTAADVIALRGLGLTVQPLHSLPFALVAGPLAALTETVTEGLGLDVYPDERLQYFDTASTDSMSKGKGAGAALRKRGFTGKGVTVGIIDSGCDATHPDLADHVTTNVKLLSPEYVNAGSTPTLVIPVDAGPYDNSDIGGGHGTHVAGIVAADSSSVTDGSRFGVAPDADLACFSIGEGLFTTAVVTAFDYILSDPDMFDIDVINNSWGNTFRQFDPQDPVAVASKAVVDKGVTVVFAAGNAGSGAVPMSLNPFSQSPWVISVAAAGVDRVRGDFSSNGLVHDNSTAVPIADDGHTVFTGDRIGVYHPDITAPGVDISSTCDSIGAVIGPCAPGDNASASGTSMASPHIAGAAAVLLQAQPKLTPTQVRLALQATATPVGATDGTGTAPFWQVGYGFANLDRAVTLVRSPGWAAKLARLARKADARVLKADGTTVVRSDLFTYEPLPVTVGGIDGGTFEVPVGKSTRSLDISLSFPSGGSLAASVFSYTVEVLDPAGTVVATSTTDPLGGAGTAVATVEGVKAGTYTFEVSGDYAVSDPDTIDSDSVFGRFVTLAVAQLKPSPVITCGRVAARC
ncbi:MAG: S8 family serine peptidase [Actinobacteria bacterium]|uniref:Unannotated protein n=1 Tax=freshwater metagenome TaxID=449393 RepID=A0A6J6NUH5_9ZZZZ|nr:S8 family serine peptidase [Actinomycetota bacterium]